MKIKEILTAISYITVYRIISIFGIILMLGIIIHTICLKSDIPTKLFNIFLAALGLFLILSLLFVVNSFRQQENKTTSSQKEGISK